MTTVTSEHPGPPDSSAAGTGSPQASGAPGRRNRPPYELAHDLDGSSLSVRTNLVDILRRELLGPADGAGRDPVG